MTDIHTVVRDTHPKVPNGNEWVSRGKALAFPDYNTSTRRCMSVRYPEVSHRVCEGMPKGGTIVWLTAGNRVVCCDTHSVTVTQPEGCDRCVRCVATGSTWW